MLETKTRAQVIPLQQGVTLIHQEVPHVSTATIDIWVKAGSSLENDSNRGAAHFVEHMIFKGTDRIAPGEFDRFVESLGSVSNAATSHDYAHYSLTTPVSHFEVVLSYLADLVLHAAIPGTEIEKERHVVLEELHQAWDDPDWLSYQVLLETVFGDHPYGSPVMGSRESVANLTLEQLRAYHQTYYQGEAITVVVVGAVPCDRVVQQVQAAFAGGFAQSLTCPYQQVKPLPGVQRECITLPHGASSRLLVSWIGPRAVSVEETIGMELLSVILAEGRSARLVKQLREEKRWVQDISSGFIAQQAAGFFTISAALQPQYLEPVEFTVLEAVSRLATEPVSAGELARARKALSNSFAFMVETPSHLAQFLGYHALLGVYDLCTAWSTAYHQAVQGVTAEQIMHLAQEYLSPDRYVSVSVLPGERA